MDPNVLIGCKRTRVHYALVLPFQGGDSRLTAPAAAISEECLPNPCFSKAGGIFPKRQIHSIPNSDLIHLQLPYFPTIPSFPEKFRGKHKGRVYTKQAVHGTSIVLQRCQGVLVTHSLFQCQHLIHSESNCTASLLSRPLWPMHSEQEESVFLHFRSCL